MRFATRTQTGFTLIEMIITLTIVGVLLTLAVPSFRQVMLNQGIRTASFDLYSALEYARSEAIKRGANVNVRAGDTTANDGSWSKGWRVRDASNNLLRSWTAASTVTIAEAGSATTVTFARDGHLTTGTAPKWQINPTTSMNGIDLRCIQVDLVGRPRTQMGACP